jgi:YopX protein
MNKNREIKFRVWDTDDKKFFTKLDDNGYFYKNPSCPTGKPVDIAHLLKFPFDNIIQQFTGCKDSKGTEIYEGDIVNVSGGLHVIEWRGAGFAATWSDYNLDSCWFAGGGPVVVGNTCENPDLAERARKSPKL